MNAQDILYAPASAVYRSVIGARRALYASGALKTYHASVPVVCIGNLSLGGTGKTPLVEYVARLMPSTGRWPGIVSRGYKRVTNPKDVVLVSDGTQILTTAAEGGDEPYLLAKTLPGIAVAVCADRHKACEYLVDRNLCDCVLLDDGFQHWSLARDADIVAIDATSDLSKMRLIPSGTLREPPSALRRAFAVIHTKVGHPDAVARRQEFYRSNRQRVNQLVPGVPQFAARFIPESLVRLSKGRGGDLDFVDLPGMRVAAFCGIANPEGFYGTLRALGADVVVQRSFPDHHHYTYPEVAQMLDAAVENECEAIITTSKDAVKLLDFELPADPPIFMLTQTVQLDDPDGFLDTLRWAVNG